MRAEQDRYFQSIAGVPPARCGRRAVEPTAVRAGGGVFDHEFEDVGFCAIDKLGNNRSVFIEFSDGVEGVLLITNNDEPVAHNVF